MIYTTKEKALEHTSGSVFNVKIERKRTKLSVWVTSVDDAMEWADENRVDGDWVNIVEHKKKD